LESAVAGDEAGELGFSNFLQVFTFLKLNFLILKKYKHVNNKSNKRPQTTMPAIIPELITPDAVLIESPFMVGEKVLLIDRKVISGVVVSLDVIAVVEIVVEAAKLVVGVVNWHTYPACRMHGVTRAIGKGMVFRCCITTPVHPVKEDGATFNGKALLHTSVLPH